MPWPVPSPAQIAERMAAAYETAIIAIRPSVDRFRLSRAVRSSRGMLAILFRTVALVLRPVHDHIAWWARQWFPDTADEDEFARRHASIWGVEPRPATVAVGSVLVEGAPATALPEGLELATGDGTLLVTTATATIDGGGTVSVAVEASEPGAAGNVEAGARLAVVTPFPEIDRVTVEVPGMAGGADEATAAEIVAAVLERIRQPPHGGAGFDYQVWLGAAFDVRAVKVVTDWIGRGSVGVIVAMRDGGGAREPSEPELDAMLAYLGPPGSSTGVRPVTAHVVVVAAEMEEIALSVRLRPDTVETRASVTAAWQRFVATIGDGEDTLNDGPIGAIIEPSRISEAISAAAGEWAHDLVVPAAPYQLEPKQYPVAAEPVFLEEE